MTDFIFSNNSGSVNVTFRTDLVSGGNNFTIMSISGLDPTSLTLNNKQRMLLHYKRRASDNEVGQYGVGDFVDFATHHELNLTQIDSKGVASVLVALGSTSS